MNSFGWRSLGTREWQYPFAISMILLNLFGCGTSSDNAAASSATSFTFNVQPIQVYSGPSELANPNVNVPYTDVTICIPGTSNCQTITDIEVDTGSSGLRLLASEVELTLPIVKDTSGNQLGECLVFADTTYVWGPIVSADIQLASEKALSVPIQLVGPGGFPQVPAECGATGAADDTIATMGSRGILGLGVFRQDCGLGCTAIAGSNAPPLYFSCPNASANSTCTAVTVPLQNQMQNPVWLFSEDNNGFLISLPAVLEQGAATASGSLIFGIGTRENNALGSAATYTTDDTGYFSTTFNGITYSGVNGSYVDSGTNLLLFPSPSTTSLPVCTDVAQLYCPSITQNYTATNQGLNGTTGQVSFSVANADSLLSTYNIAFSNLAGPVASGFTWGLPFFFGRSVFLGIEGQDTPAGTGPFWAY